MMSRSLVAKGDPASAVSAAAGLPCRLRHEVLRQDCETVRGLVARTGFFTCDEVEIAVELVEARLSDGPASGYEFIFAEMDGALAGYACYGPIPCTAAGYDLYWIAVEPTFQRHGVGRMLMDAVESQVAAQSGERIYIDTSGRNQYAPTRAFYERSGFYAEARLKDFYAPGDDRVIYVKSLLKSC
ncbi:MAG TPA: GNAT family N-acetyltransferase [Lacipirellulaceae bacterium]|nr:GNAT family N-acetyltransferase [Lacipirellulaceae bacterium]